MKEYDEQDFTHHITHHINVLQPAHCSPAPAEPSNLSARSGPEYVVHRSEMIRVAALALAATAATAFTSPRQLPRRVLRTSASAGDAVCPLLSEPTSPVATFAMG